MRQQLFSTVRGKGMAYGAGVSLSESMGAIYFSLYRASNVVGAYAEFRYLGLDAKSRICHKKYGEDFYTEHICPIMSCFLMILKWKKCSRNMIF